MREREKEAASSLEKRRIEKVCAPPRVVWNLQRRQTLLQPFSTLPEREKIRN